MESLNERPTVGQRVHIVRKRRDYTAERAAGRYERVYVEETVEGEVTKVGTKYAVVVTASAGGARTGSEYYWSTGFARHDYGGVQDRMFTEEGFLRWTRREAALAVIAKAGMKVSRAHGFGDVDLTVEQWESIAAALEVKP